MCACVCAATATTVFLERQWQLALPCLALPRTLRCAALLTHACPAVLDHMVAWHNAAMTSTPSIRVSHPQRYHTPPSHPAPSASPSPMAIPHVQAPVPPPLPPPTYIPELSTGEDPGWLWGNDPNRSDFGRPATVKPGSSLLGGGARSMGRGYDQENHSQTFHHDVRRGSSLSTVTDVRGYEMGEDSYAYSGDRRGSTIHTSNYG